MQAPDNTGMCNYSSSLHLRVAPHEQRPLKRRQQGLTEESDAQRQAQNVPVHLRVGIAASLLDEGGVPT